MEGKIEVGRLYKCGISNLEIVGPWAFRLVIKAEFDCFIQQNEVRKTERQFSKQAGSWKLSELQKNLQSKMNN